VERLSLSVSSAGGWRVPGNIVLIGEVVVAAAPGFCPVDMEGLSLLGLLSAGMGAVALCRRQRWK